MKRFVLNLIWLTSVWVALWGSLSAANILAGLAVATGVVWLFRSRRSQRRTTLRLVPAAHFLAYFVRKLVEASVVVAWEVVTPRNRINEAIVAVPLQTDSDLLTTIVANAISLTPGTLTIDVGKDPNVLYVHVLHLSEIDDVRREVGRLEALAAHAFATG